MENAVFAIAHPEWWCGKTIWDSIPVRILRCMRKRINVTSHAKRRRGAAGLEGFAHSASAVGTRAGGDERSAAETTERAGISLVPDTLLLRELSHLFYK